MSAEETDPEIDVRFTFTRHPFEQRLKTLSAADRAGIVITVQDEDDPSSNTQAELPLEIITVIENVHQLRKMAELFTILSGATEQAADQLEAQTQSQDTTA